MNTKPFLHLSFTILFILMIGSTSNVFPQVFPPGISWKSVDYITDYPDAENDTLFNDPSTDIEESSEDWWYDHQPILENGQVVGYITCGYSQIMNWGFDEAPNGGCYSNVTASGSPEFCDDVFDFQEFNQRIGRFNRTTMQTIARFDVYGHKLWFKTYNEGWFQHIIQTADGNFAAVGPTRSTRVPENQSVPLYYNPGQFNDPYYFGSGDLPCLDPPARRGKANVVKINGEGIVVWNYLYGIDNAKDDPTACSRASYEANDIVEYDTCSTSPKLRIAGRASTFINQSQGGTDRFFMIDLNSDDGYFNWGQDYLGTDLNDTALESIAWVIGKAGSCDGNVETIIMAGREKYFIDGTITCKVMAFRASDANPSPIWTQYINGPSQTIANHHAVAFDMVERSNGNILLPVIYDCGNCQYSGINFGEAAVYEIDPSNGDTLSPSPYLITDGSYSGKVNAYDLKIGITNTPDNGFAIATSKVPVPYDTAHGMHTWTCSGTGDTSVSYWNSNACVRKYDANGDLQWEKIFDIDDKQPEEFPGDLKRQECMYSISNSPDGGLVIAGNCSRNFDDSYLVKLFDNCNNEQAFDIEPADILESPVIPVDSLPSNPLTGSHKIRGSIVIADGESLIIDGAYLEFADTRKCGFITNITVQTGGELYITNESVLTSIAACEFSMWDGIQVQGDSGAAQEQSNQGFMRIDEKSKIENARHGTLVDAGDYIVKETENPLNDQHLIKDLVMRPNGGGGGGIITVDDGTTYRNCRKSIVFSPYLLTGNQSKIAYSNFICDAPVNDYDAVDQYGYRTGVNSFLSLWGIKQLSVRNNHFINTLAWNYPVSWNSKGTVLGSFDASYVFRNNELKGTTFGISSGAANPLLTFWAEGNTFDSISFAITVNQVDYVTIIDNDITVGPDGYPYGLYMENCTAYKIEQNDFKNIADVNAEFGIVNYYTEENNLINEIYRNTFDNFEYSVLLEGEHRNDTNDIYGLQIRCNDYSNYVYAQAVTLGPGIAGHQGTFDPNNPDYTKLANNIFRGNACSVTNGEITNNSGFNPISKYWHSLNNASFQQFVVPVSGCYDTTQVFPQLNNVIFDSTSNCPDLRPHLRLTNSSNLFASYRQFSLAELHDIEERLIEGSSIDTSALVTQASLAADNVVRMYLADTTLTHAYDSVFYFLTSLARYNTYQAKCAASLTSANSPVRLASLSLALNSNQTSLFSLQDFIANHPHLDSNHGYKQITDSLIAVANDSTWFGSSALKSWLCFKELKYYPPVIVLPIQDSLHVSEKSYNEKIIKTVTFSVFPNPSSGFVSVSMDDPLEKIREIIIRALDGRIILRKFISNESNTINLKLEDINPGLYLIEVLNNQNKNSNILLSILK